MGRYPFKVKRFLEVALFFLVIHMNVMTPYAQPGFLSIDCGSSRDRNDTIGVSWVTDTQYIRTGKNSISSFTVDEDYDNYQALRNSRYFPESPRRSKYCYELNTTSTVFYLIRAMFYYSNETMELGDLPIEFIVYVNSTNWFTVTVSNDTVDDGSDLSVGEGIFYSGGSVMFICLQPVTGVPFISSLELRQLDSNMYNYTGNRNYYLSSQIRMNTGVAYDTPTVRFPDDPFDRFWYPQKSWDWADESHWIHATTPSDRIGTVSAAANNVPSKVMEDAWVNQALPGGWIRFSFALPLTEFPTAPVPVDFVYAVAYFKELNTSLSGERSINVSWYDGTFSDDLITANANASMKVSPTLALGANWMPFTFYIPESSAAGLIVNALEVYAQFRFNISVTKKEDVDAIKALQTTFNLTDWQGDPCVPVPYDWLSCTNLNHGDLNNGGEPCVSADITECTDNYYLHSSTFSVSTIKFFNMSGASTTNISSINKGNRMPGLIEMSIIKSEVNNNIFEFLVQSYTGGALQKLNLSNNEIDTIPLSSYWDGKYNLDTLDLSSNKLVGGVPFIINMPFNGTLQNLNLSYNKMTSLPTKWGNTTTSLVLKTLDLSHNSLVGEISSLDELVKRTSGSLQELYISDNKLGGNINSSLYFSQQILPNLQIVNFDQNEIMGILNLSLWHTTLQDIQSNNDSAAHFQLFSFLNNRISDITPRAEDFQPIFEHLLEYNLGFKNKGVLLGGNPYCEGAKSQIQKYLCRFNVSDEYGQEKEEKKTWLLILLIVGGIILFLVCCLLLATIWSMWRQTYALKQIQQALANQKVQPPFYSYHDIKTATNDFHEDNKLGKGAFGVVYKGVLADKTKLAVKKLFNSQKEQVLNEFLNEVVLITGIKHKNLVQLKGCCIQGKQRMLVYEFVENGNLAEVLQGSNTHIGLTWEQRLEICVGLARGLSYLHEELEPCLIHRDIKPANILLDQSFRPKIADFGLARPLSDSQSQALYTQVAGTLGYFSPEYATQGQLTEKADVYSYGVVVLEIVSGRTCIDYSLPPDRIFLKDWARTMHKNGTLFDILDPHLKERCVESEVIQTINIALLCVQGEPQRRPTMSQVITMFLAFFSNKSDVKSLRFTNDYDIKLPSLQKISEEESDDFPLLDISMDSQYSSGTGTSTSIPKLNLELGTMSGR